LPENLNTLSLQRLRGYQGLEFQLSELTDRKLIKFFLHSLDTRARQHLS